MPRVKRGTVRRAKRKKLLGLAKGYFANKSKLYRSAKESVDTALKYAFVGRRLPELLRGAGLTDIGVEAKADIYPPGHSRRSIRLDLVRSMRPRILERGIASEQELDELDRAAQRHLDDPRTLVLPHLLFLAWGRKPAREGGTAAAPLTRE